MRTLHQANLDESGRTALRTAADAIHRSCPWVSRVVLFGSYARGEAWVDSDMDLLVLTSRPVSRAERHAITGALSPLGRNLGVMFSTLVADEESWSRGVYRVLPIHAEIERDGVAA